MLTPATSSTFNQLRARWANDEAAIIGWLQIPSPLSAEALAHCGYDGLVVDLQHSPVDIATATTMFTAIEAGGAEPLARVLRNDPAEICRVLDAGAYGVIVPGIDNAEQAAAVADAVHYPPDGRRSFGPRRPLLRYGTGYVQNITGAVVTFAMIETEAGLDNLDTILSVRGIDGLFIGPADLALALGAPPRADPTDDQMLAAFSHVRERAHAHGRKAGIFCKGAEFAGQMLADGFDLVSVSPDLTSMTDVARSAVELVRRGSPQVAT